MAAENERSNDSKKRLAFSEYIWDEESDGRQSGLIDDIDFFKRSDKKTGYANIDERQNLYNGFFCIGGGSSIGKTTFVHQMADQIAGMGTPVLYFALEQTKAELACKSLARAFGKEKQSNGENYREYSSLEIRMGKADEKELNKIRQQYRKVAENLYIYENSDATVEWICKEIDEFISEMKKDNHGGEMLVSPVVCLDYLQIVKTEDKRGGSDVSGSYSSIDHVVNTLRKCQMNNNITLIAICSLNRANYLAPVSFESFRLSGNIEYTADVVWGLQLQVMREEIFQGDSATVAKRNKMNEAKNSIPRKIELVVLKNRFGSMRESFLFDYFPDRDLFVADGIGPHQEEKLENTNDSLREIQAIRNDLRSKLRAARERAREINAQSDQADA